MGLYLDSPDIDAITGDIKKQISIGICGSFSEVDKPILDRLKEYLKENQYAFVFTADDYPNQQQQITNGDAKYDYSYGKSIDMVNTCDIIIFIFMNSDQDSEVNQSAIIELQEACSRRIRNIIVLTENGFTFRNNLKGIKYRSRNWWDWHDFSIDKITDCYMYVKQSCHNLILGRLVRRDK